ncbi:MAG: DNA internalization-related competence protein ComEC/Rec2 [Rhodocyclaceae bacterium]|nr:DNA internalization-related competence protein ComEC/Rec2 [Rhodocyclaceae bacterium]
MREAVFAFTVGVLLLQWQPQLPEGYWFWLLAALGVAACAFQRFGLFLLGAALLGFAWAGLRAEARLADALPLSWEGREMIVVGVVEDLPQPSEHGVRFAFRVEQASGPAPTRLALTWRYGEPKGNEEDAPHLGQMRLKAAPKAGERWRLSVRLMRPQGTLNFHGFDYEAWLFERGIRATGLVREGAENRRLAAGPVGMRGAIDCMRETVRARILAAFPGVAGGILAALAIGDQNAIPPEYWQLFAATGVTHLMSISGLHVTLFGALLGWGVFRLWRRHARLPLVMPAASAAAIATFIGAGAYAVVAGFGIPAQRTLYMLGVTVVAMLSRRALASADILALSLGVVLLIDPWAVLAAGFWLSFGAVALLLFISSGRLVSRHWLREAVRAQWAVTLGLIPALLVLFQQFSLVSPLANAVAIPVVSFFITPMALVGGLAGVEVLLKPAAWAIEFLLDFLRACAWLPFSLWQQAAPPLWAISLAVVGVLWWLMPRGWPARWLGGVFLLPALAYVPERPAFGEAWVTVLDVGQGLSVHVQTAHHDLLYDAGPASAAFDAGSRIVIPSLRAIGVRRLDAMIISHDDRDHSGGAISVLSALPVDVLLAPKAYGSTHEARPCLAGQSWVWDGVRFHLLHPPSEDFGMGASDNTRSCVVKIETPLGARALLPGDLEGAAERFLLARERESLAAELLIAAHHGARNTASADFLAAVRPEVVVIPVGYRNRFGHPHPATLTRFKTYAQQVLRSDWHGAVRVRLSARAEVVARARDERRRYWHNAHESAVYAFASP